MWDGQEFEMVTRIYTSPRGSIPPDAKNAPLAGYLFILVGRFLVLRLGKFE